jgi:hypothetical protein
MAFRRSSSVEMRTPAILSAGVHVIALVVAIANFDWFRSPPLEPEPVMVDFVKIDKHAAAPKIGVQDPPPKEAKIAEETSKAPPPKTAEALPTPPEPPKKEVAEAKPIAPMPVEKPDPKPPKPTEDVVALKPKEPEPPKKEEKKIETPKPEPIKPEVKKVEPTKPPLKPPEPKKVDVDALVASLANRDKNPPIKTPDSAPKKPTEITRQAPVAPHLAADITASEQDGVKAKVRDCWFSPGGSKDAPIIKLTVQMRQDGTPISAELRDPNNRDPLYLATADRAMRAVLNPRCHPWPLPPEKYNSWRYINFNFDPRDY